MLARHPAGCKSGREDLRQMIALANLAPRTSTIGRVRRGRRTHMGCRMPWWIV